MLQFSQEFFCDFKSHKSIYYQKHTIDFSCIIILHSDFVFATTTRCLTVSFENDVFTFGTPKQCNFYLFFQALLILFYMLCSVQRLLVKYSLVDFSSEVNQMLSIISCSYIVMKIEKQSSKNEVVWLIFICSCSVNHILSSKMLNFLMLTTTELTNL